MGQVDRHSLWCTPAAYTELFLYSWCIALRVFNAIMKGFSLLWVLKGHTFSRINGHCVSSKKRWQYLYMSCLSTLSSPSLTELLIMDFLFWESVDRHNNQHGHSNITGPDEGLNTGADVLREDSQVGLLITPRNLKFGKFCRYCLVVRSEGFIST